MKKKDNNNPIGVIMENLPNLTYRVELPNGNSVIAYMGGKMKMARVSLLVGDRVEVVLDPMGGKATNRIVWRH
jgi:translation initiation factor IF-1